MNIQQLVSSMRKLEISIFWFLLITQTLNISLDLKATQASLYSDNKIVLRFIVRNAASPFQIKFQGIPFDWSEKNNDLVIVNFSLNSKQEWTFDMSVTDRGNNQLFQTVKMTLDGYQIELIPVTVEVKDNMSAQSQNKQPSNSYNLNGKEVAPASFSQYTFESTNSGANRYSLSQYYISNYSSYEDSFDIRRLIDSYPGIFGYEDQDSKIAYAIDSKSSVGANATSVQSNSIITPSLAGGNTGGSSSNQITEYEIKRNAAFLRQSNAQEAVANIVIFIQEISKSIKDSQGLIKKIQQQLKASESSVVECNIQLFDLSNTQTKIENAIKDREQKIKQLETQVQNNLERSGSLSKQLLDLEKQKQETSKRIQPEGNQLLNMQKSLRKCEAEINGPLSQIDEKNAELKKNIIDFNLIQNEMKYSQPRGNQVNNSLLIVRKKIVSLKEQIKIAQIQQKALVEQQKYYAEIPQKGRQKLEEIKRSNEKLNKEISGIKQLIQGNEAKCSTYVNRVNDLKVRIAVKQKTYETLNNESNQVVEQLNSLSQQASVMKERTSSLSLEKTVLENEMERYKNRVKQQEYLCGVNKGFVDQFVNDLDSEEKNLERLKERQEQAQLNLEKARSEKELADLAVQEIIADSTKALPYSIVPNGGSPLLGGQPYGNNPSGSVLGPAFRADANSTGVKKPVQVGNLSNYLSTVYGMNIDPLKLFESSNEPQTKANPSPTPTNNFGLNFQNFLPGSTLITTPVISTASTPTVKSSTTVPSVYLRSLTTEAKLFPLDNESKKRISSGAGLSTFPCNDGKAQNKQGTLESVSLGSIGIRDILNQKYTLSIGTCTMISSTKQNIFFIPGSKVFFSGVQAYQVLGNVLFNTHSLLIVPQ